MKKKFLLLGSVVLITGCTFTNSSVPLQSLVPINEASSTVPAELPQLPDLAPNLTPPSTPKKIKYIVRNKIVAAPCSSLMKEKKIPKPNVSRALKSTKKMPSLNLN